MNTPNIKSFNPVSVSDFQKITIGQLTKSKQAIQKQKRKQWGNISHSWIFYFLSWILLSLYTGKACPFVDEDFLFAFLDSLLQQVSLAIFISIFPIYILRIVMFAFIRKETMFKWSQKKYALFEFVFFLIWVIELLIAGLYFGFLVESILKLTVGAFMFGFFSVLNMFLLRHKYQILNPEHVRHIFSMNIKKFISIRTKFIFISTVVLLLVGVVISLVSYKNFLWLIHNYSEILLDQQLAILSVFKEIVFIIAVFIGWMIVSIINYTTNVKIIFVLFNESIYNIFNEMFENLSVPILNDEFGVMGENINLMTEELKEKAVIKTTFGKFVNPRIAELILKNGATLDQKGAARDIVVLFSDIRGFTTFAHKKEPRDVVDTLNNYFTHMVEIVEKNDGMVDKFIGDALMGLFGYDDIHAGINNAVHAAYQMQEFLHNNKNSFSIGIGIGVGSAIVGLVGSPDRLDFTAIGDIVNTAARLEGETPKLRVDILIDERAYQLLNPDLKHFSWKKFEIKVKGISKPLKTYGLKFNKRRKYIKSSDQPNENAT